MQYVHYISECRQNGGYNASPKDTPLRSYYRKFTTSTNKKFGVTADNLMNAVQSLVMIECINEKPDSC